MTNTADSEEERRPTKEKVQEEVNKSLSRVKTSPQIV
jgi:hypothetical protein